MLKGSIIGNLGNDPELKYTPAGQAVLRMNVAANQRVKVEGEWQDATEWVRVTVFGARAESLANLLKKGTRVYTDGRLEARPWTNNQGEVKAGLELVANDVEFASNRKEDGASSPNWEPIKTGQPAAKPSKRAAQADMEDALEDLPF